MPHKRAKAVGKLLLVENKKALRSIDRFGIIDKRNIIRELGIKSIVTVTDILSTNLMYRQEKLPSRFLAK